MARVVRDRLPPKRTGGKRLGRGRPKNRRPAASDEEALPVMAVSAGVRGGTRAAEKITLWDSWLRRDSLKARLGERLASRHRYLSPTGPVLRRPVETAGVNRKWQERGETDAIDPEPTFAPPLAVSHVTVPIASCDNSIHPEWSSGREEATRRVSATSRAHYTVAKSELIDIATAGAGSPPVPGRPCGSYSHCC
jgi:hypothetical protein